MDIHNIVILWNNIHMDEYSNKIIERTLTKIGNGASGLLMMTFAFSGWSWSWRRWRWWRSHAGGWTDHDRRRWWRRRLSLSEGVWCSHLILRWHQNRFTTSMNRLLGRSRAPSMQNSDGASNFRLQLRRSISRRMSHFWALIPLSRVTHTIN